MKRLAAIVTVLGMMTMVRLASANEYTPGQICQTNDLSGVSYDWSVYRATKDNPYSICPVPRQYNTVNTAKAYVRNAGGTLGGYVNFVSTDGTYSNWNYAQTLTAGDQTITFAAINNPSGLQGFVNFEINFMPNGSLIRGFYTN